MTKIKNVFILLFCLSWAKTTIASYIPGNQVINVNKSVGVADSGGVSGDWFKLSQLNINTVGDISSFNSNPCVPLNFLCTGGLVSLGYNGKANYSLEITRHVATIIDDTGNNYMFTLAFPEKPPVVGIYENNQAVVGRVWNTRAAIDNSFDSPPVSQQDTANASASAQGYCGNISVGCNYAIAAYMHADSGMPYLYAKLPKNISAKSISFKDIKLLEFKITVRNQKGDADTPVTAKLYISGAISVPQRCYIKADKNSFDFGTVYSNANNGSVKNVSTSITTDCYYAPVGTTQSLKIDAVSGGTLNDRATVYQVASDPTLGIVFNMNASALCDSSNIVQSNIFKQEYLLNKIFVLQQRYTSTDTINFSLCKYGVPSITGQKTVILKLTSRWVIN
ncbi:TPA: hypothetical protein PX820_004963 [Escherichia coli]|nr:hypothetical protein [Escherichia coli]HCI9178828.1 hypothetical protein [Shigella dysenteriae]HCI9108901.1 hypothetical protein [Escherichia coli]HCI9133567.1 hypothetical protein [Escherichia coli]HDL9596213.1 hypothetical protein [Escherichia coli]